MNFSNTKIYAFHGLQGSGKTTLVNELHRQAENNDNIDIVTAINIKHTFSRHLKFLERDYKWDLSDEKFLGDYKKLQLAISTAVEKHDPLVWSNEYKVLVAGFIQDYSNEDSSAVITTDDIRVLQNVTALMALANAGVDVNLIFVECSEEIRRERLGEDRWRPETNYTEKGLFNLGNQLHHPLKFHTINTEGSFEESFKQLRDIVA